MVRLKVSVKVERRKGKPIYTESPDVLFKRFVREVDRVVSSLDRSRKSNRVLSEFLREEKSVIEELDRVFSRMDKNPLFQRKKVCDVFYRIFQRLRWAEEAGSEREIELRGWVLSSLDLLLEVFGREHG
ncbi:hypothetical protein SAMN06265339_1462 [Desulfurobacterium pacificum]|uniref:CRISPR type III A-associated protein Csm2 n=1 Tax=Desulfurobacterium pacificum TaxID=240166 RepID=A0ABY1NQV9_9BACT|nr:hypothetical protein [Desulfurobacterium pacificum]SMP15875.1 hypothetical protein SAMN06265339_1462 [Desulfurobacterium pacificum]